MAPAHDPHADQPKHEEIPGGPANQQSPETAPPAPHPGEPHAPGHGSTAAGSDALKDALAEHAKEDAALQKEMDEKTAAIKAERTAEDREARADVNDHVDPVGVHPAKPVTLVGEPQLHAKIGAAITGGKPTALHANKIPLRQTAMVNQHTTVVDLLRHAQMPVDGSVRILSATGTPFDMDEKPYHNVIEGEQLQVVHHTS